METDIVILTQLHIGHVKYAVIVYVQEDEWVLPFVLKIFHWKQKIRVHRE